MDGIVPLQAGSKDPKPVSLVKNDIISENAEVCFDPIVPLPVPIKARPKLRPVPRLTPLRRSIVQASVSKADDESRGLLSGGEASTSAAAQQGHDGPHCAMDSSPNRKLKRIRNESVSSSVSQATPQPSAASSPERHLSKCRREDIARTCRMSARRRLRETGQKETLTMYDLIFTNPTGNPFVPDEAQLANEKEEAARKAAIEQEKDKQDQTGMKIDVAPVPQVKLGPNGEIVLDKKSLEIKQTEKRKVSSHIVHEGASCSTSSGYRRTKRSALWTDQETSRFYRALSSLGTDFMLMENLFPGRNRRLLKLKFKKEERVNMAEVTRALSSTCKWDVTRLENEFRAEREKEEKAAEELKQRAIEKKRQKKEQGRRRPSRPLSLSARLLGASALPAPAVGLTADELINLHFEAKTQESKASSQSATTTRVMPKSNDMATTRKKDTKPQGKAPVKQPPKIPELPSNIKEGSFFVVKINDPDSPPKRKLLPYKAKAGGRLSPVNLPKKALKMIYTFMETGVIPNDTSAGSAASPSSAASQNSLPCLTDPTPAVI